MKARQNALAGDVNKLKERLRESKNSLKELKVERDRLAQENKGFKADLSSRASSDHSAENTTQHGDGSSASKAKKGGRGRRGARGGGCGRWQKLAARAILPALWVIAVLDLKLIHQRI